MLVRDWIHSFGKRTKALSAKMELRPDKSRLTLNLGILKLNEKLLFELASVHVSVPRPVPVMQRYHNPFGSSHPEHGIGIFHINKM